MNKKQKIFIISFISILLILPFIFKEKKVEFNLITKTLVKFVNNDFKRQDERDLMRNYSISNDLYNDFYSFVSESFMDVNEITVIKQENVKKQNIIIKCIEEYIKNKRNTFAGYGPKQVELLDNAIIEIKNDYVFLIIDDDCKTIWQKIDKLF